MYCTPSWLWGAWQALWFIAVPLLSILDLAVFYFLPDQSLLRMTHCFQKTGSILCRGMAKKLLNLSILMY